MPALIGPIAKLAWGGSMAGGDEWSCSVMLAGMSADPTVPENADGFKLPLSDWFLRDSTHIATSTTLDYVKFNLIDKATGRYSNPSESFTSLYTPPFGWPHDAVFAVPNQLTQCVTIHSDLSRGRGSKGRFYPPTNMRGSTTNAFGTDGRNSVYATQAMADSAQELLSEINSAAEGFRVCVWSQAGQGARAVDRVSVGRVIDTQRRRRNSLDEGRLFAAAGV